MGLFDAIRKVRQSAQERANALQDELQVLKARRDAIQAAPAARSEIKDLVHKRVAALGAQALRESASVLRSLALNPASNGSDDAIRAIGLLSAGRGRNESVSAEAMDALLCALFPAAVTEALVATVDKLDVPDGPTAEARAQELLAVGERIATLEAELAAIYREAEAAGVSLT